MWTIKQPSEIIFGGNSSINFSYPKNCLIITSKGTKSRGWLEDLKIQNNHIYDCVEPNPSLEKTQNIISEFQNFDFTHVIGLGGGSSLDVAKFVAMKLKRKKILIPTTFGSGSEVTRISVLKVDGKKKSFHNDQLIANTAIIDPFFLKQSPIEIIKNAAIDACAQCTEAYDSKNSNPYTKFFCKTAFDVLEDGIINENYEKLPYGSLLTGLGFGNSSTTLGHALSYVFSNEGISHGHALAFTTTIAHKFNNSIFYDRFLKIVKKLKMKKIRLKENIEKASELILLDKKHLENNPKKISKKEIMKLLEIINETKI
jgi:succinate semialdehyde reductase